MFRGNDEWTYIYIYIYIYVFGHFPKRYSKQKRINVTFECRWHVLHFLLVAGPQLNAVVLQGSARFAQGSRKVLIVQLGRCQKPESRWFWQTRGKIVRKLRASFAQAHAQARPSRATTCPCATTCPFWLSTLLFSELLFSEQLLFFPFLHFPQTVQPHVPMYLQLKSAPRKRRWLVLGYKKNCLSLCLDETRASEMYWIRSGPPSESTKRSNLGKDISEKTHLYFLLCTKSPYKYQLYIVYSQKYTWHEQIIDKHTNISRIDRCNKETQ